MDPIQKAKLFCQVAHNACGQTRKVSGEPYWTHPFAVADLVELSTSNDDLYIAALLHDTVEDTNITLDFIAAEFGENVRRLVQGLTDPEVPSDLTRAEKKDIFLKRLMNQPADVQTIKYADMYHNLGEVDGAPKAWIYTFTMEKEKAVEALDKGCPYLRNLVRKRIRQIKVTYGFE